MIRYLHQLLRQSVRLVFPVRIFIVLLLVAGTPLHARNPSLTDQRFIDLDSEVQNIKSEALEINKGIRSLQEASFFPRSQQPSPYDEALFYSYQQDYIAAISQLQLAQDLGTLAPDSVDAGLLLARSKLAYGMPLEAAFDFHARLTRAVDPLIRNQAWCDLARAFARRGYHAAAIETLEHIQGKLPEETAGDCQLLRATVLMSLNQNSEAAETLTQWHGRPVQEAYAHYNRGIALIRAGDYAQAVSSLEMAIDRPAGDEERLALRDRARLMLGYASARNDDYLQASAQLEAVRANGPFSSQALLALGWVAYQQGRGESALASWAQLQHQSPSDPAVLEALLLASAVRREVGALGPAIRDFETAVTVYGNELDQMAVARKTVLSEEAMERLLQSPARPAQDTREQASHTAKRFLGPMLASRQFVQTRQDYSELHTLLDNIDRGLRAIDSLPRSNSREQQTAQGASRAPGQESGPSAPAGAAGNNGDATWQHEWVYRNADPDNDLSPVIPPLPEIELPTRRTVKPYPKQELSGPLPVSKQVIDPPQAQIAGLPIAEILSMPSSGEFFGRPNSAEFLRRPGEGKTDDYAHPDPPQKKRLSGGNPYAYQLSKLLPAEDQEPGFNTGAVPVGSALRELATALERGNEGINDRGDGLDARIAALRSRMLKIRKRIGNTLALQRDYTRALALEELERRQLLLEGLLEQAHLELAKAYDQSSDS